jgi:hypothetical protein
MIKDVIGRPFFTTVARNINTNNETKLDKVASEDEIIDEPLEVKVEDIAKEIDVAPIADVEAETTVANELVEAVAEDVVAEAIVIENEAPVEVEADKTDEIAAKLEKLIVAVGEIVEKLSAIDLEAIVSAGFEKLIVAPSEVAPEAKTEDVRAETPVEAEVKPFVLGEEQIKAIAAEVLVGMNEINVRKGIVNAPESKKEAPAIDLKSMTADQLSRIIAKRAVGVAE